MTVRSIVFSLALALLPAAPASATLLTAGTYVFNVDLTSAVPYPWANVRVDTGAYWQARPLISVPSPV